MASETAPESFAEPEPRDDAEERAALEVISDEAQPAATEAPASAPESISGEASDRESDGVSEAGAEDSRSRGVPVWLVLIGVVLAALAVGYQVRVAGQLEAKVAGLESKLGQAEALVDAHRSHLTEVRGGVRELSAQLEGLQALVETEPVAKPVAQRPSR